MPRILCLRCLLQNKHLHTYNVRGCLSLKQVSKVHIGKCIHPNIMGCIYLPYHKHSHCSWNWSHWSALNSLRWRHNELDGVSDHQPHDCLLNRLFGRRSKKTSKLRVTGLCAGNSPGTGEFPAQMASYGENVSIWWRHHAVFTREAFWLDAHLLAWRFEKADAF